MFDKPTAAIRYAQSLFASRVHEDWALVSAGVPGDWNTMTIGWGSAGTLWSTPVVSVFVHPLRHTHHFLLRETHFCVQMFDARFKRDLAYLGAHSGRDGDKVAHTSLTPCPIGTTVGFEEAHITLVCRKVYTHHMDLGAVPQEVIHHFSTRGNLYDREAHTVFVGEIVEAIAPDAPRF